MRFKPGQEIVCVMGHWSAQEYHVPAFGPRRDELVVVRHYVSDWQLVLVGYEFTPLRQAAAFNEVGFEPVLPSEEIEKLMEEVSVPEIDRSSN
jgi:hypothetical protein